MERAIVKMREIDLEGGRVWEWDGDREGDRENEGDRSGGREGVGVGRR